MRWNAFWSGNDDGESRAESKSCATPGEVTKYQGWSESFRRSSGHIDVRREISVGSVGPQKRRREREEPCLVFSFSLLHGVHWRRSCCVGLPKRPLDLPCAQIGEHYGRYRLHLPEAERAMAKSLERYGQMSPVVVFLWDGRYELVDGFKRLAAARGSGRADLCGPLIGGRRALGQGGHLRVEPRQRPHCANWKKRGSSMRWCARTG